MTSERAKAYGRVTAALEDIGPTKLQPQERELVRSAADTLIFCEDVAADPAALEALEAVRELARHLVESERWLEETADQLLRDLEATGPLAPSGASEL